MDDSRDAWLEALGEIEPKEAHEHSWFPALGARTVFDCACGERRVVPPGMSPDQVANATQLGGSVANCLFVEMKDGMTLSHPPLTGSAG